jgi:hypothetical protein
MSGFIGFSSSASGSNGRQRIRYFFSVEGGRGSCRMRGSPWRGGLALDGVGAMASAFLSAVTTMSV